jgi:hypothetical protein
MLDDERQASADSEITEEMINAGLDVFWMHEPGGDLACDTVREIFEAMISAQKRSLSAVGPEPLLCLQSGDALPLHP